VISVIENPSCDNIHEKSKNEPDHAQESRDHNPQGTQNSLEDIAIAVLRVLVHLPTALSSNALYGEAFNR
jgi:hypothetical protein